MIKRKFIAAFRVDKEELKLIDKVSRKVRMHRGEFARVHVLKAAKILLGLIDERGDTDE